MKCPFCNFSDTKVTDSRSLNDDTTIRRRRMCEKCGKRFTTYERIDRIPVMVIKRNGDIEPFDRDKLLNGIVKSCIKRPVNMQEMEGIVDQIENTILASLDQEVRTEKIGELVMDKLKDLDEVAYVRFASVYRQFKDINTFMAELSKLLSEKDH